MMLDKILVPLDESTLAECTLPHVATIARVFDSQVTLLHVLERNDAQEQAQIDPLDWHLRKVEAQTYLDGLAERWRKLGLPVESLVLEGPAADRVIEHAYEQAFDLIALSSHGRSGLSGWNVSSVVQKVIHRAHKSILLVRAYQLDEDCNGMQPTVAHYRRILAPLDGSQRAESVLPLAIRLAREHEAEFVVAHVVARPEMLQRTPLTTEDNELVERLIERNRTEAIRYFEQLQSRLPAASQTRLHIGDNVASALHHLVERDEIDLVMLSAHGYSGDSQRPYGGVVTSLITYGATPLLIFQDLPAREIELTKAEEAARVNGASSGQRRINARLSS
jgi:nucleotide-binding universal stress UspA family protein